MWKPIKYIGKKIADDFVGTAITTARLMLIAVLTSALTTLIVFWREARHPRLLATCWVPQELSWLAF
jgi:hypothetical protein